MTRRTGLTPVLAAVLWLAALFLPWSAWATIQSITIDPPVPNCTDEVTIRVAGWFPDECWDVTGISSSRSDSSFLFEIEARESPGFCADIFVDYDAVHEAGRLDPGTYTVRVEERTSSGPFPGPPGDRRTEEFEVECCAPARRGRGYWHRQCLGAGLISPGRRGQGPRFASEPAFGEVAATVDAVLREKIGVSSSCSEGMSADPPWDPCERAIEQYTALLFDVASGRLQRSCTIDLRAGGCESQRVATLIDELAALIRTGQESDCRVAAACAAVAAKNESGAADHDESGGF